MARPLFVRLAAPLLIVWACIAFSAPDLQAQMASEIHPIAIPSPTLPAAAKDPIYGWKAAVSVIVDKTGHTTGERMVWGVLAPCSNPKDPTVAAIRQALIDASKLATFKPVLKDGKPVEVPLRLTYDLGPKLIDPDLKTVSGGIINGKALSLTTPNYPPSAK